MSSEGNIRKLLRIRAALEERSEALQDELGSIKIALAEVDRAITSQGFKQSSFVPAIAIQSDSETKNLGLQPAPTAPSSESNIPVASRSFPPTPVTTNAGEEAPDSSSVQSKDGTILGSMMTTDDSFTFIPHKGLNFTTSTPPWQSFLIERVLASMRTADEAKAATGEISTDQILEYVVEVDGEIIKMLKVRNFGGERRLREIQSSLRWSLDKMFDKTRRG